MEKEAGKFFAALTSMVAVAAAIASSSSVIGSELGSTKTTFLLLGTLSAALGAYLSVYMARRIKINKKARQVFIIYSRKDVDAASKISNIIKDAGFYPWVDTEQLVPGQNWKNEIRNALDNSGATVVLVSHNLQDSNYAKNELDAAIKKISTSDDRTTTIIPVIIDSTTPPDELADIHWIDFSQQDYREKLIRGLELATSTSRASMSDVSSMT